MIMSAAVLAQTNQDRIITGIVKDTNGDPLIGVSITEKNEKAGTVTDIEGRFSISVKKNNTILIFSYLGFNTHEENTGNKQQINVTLEENTKQLDEIVVVGYGTMKKRDLSGAVSQVRADELLKGNPASSINQALQGRLAGVQVSQNDGAPGGGINIQIRGINSFGSSTQPLYIVDGIPFEVGTTSSATGGSDGSDPTSNPLSMINPHDIESMEILKDASATAIYGSRGANGVVLITTKKGKSGKPRIEFSSNFGVSTVIKKIDMLDAYNYALYNNEQFVNDNKYYGTSYVTPAYAGIWKYYEDANGNRIGASYNPKPEDFLKPGWYYDEYGNKEWIEGTDWQDKIFQTATSQEYNLLVSGGNDTGGTYSFSGNYLNQNGTIKKSGYERYTLRANVGQKVGKILELGLNLNYANSKNDFAKTGSNEYGVLRSALFYPSTIYYGDNSIQSNLELQGLTSNPYTYVMSAKDEMNSQNVFASAFAEINFTDYLKFRQNIGLNNTTGERSTYYDNDTWGGQNVGGYGGWANTKNSHMTSESMLTFNNTFNKIHNINAVAAFTAERGSWQELRISATGFPTDITGNYDMGSALLPNKPYTYKSRGSLLSLLGRVNYVLMDKYIFTASFRRDGSSKFAENNRYANFASGALAWRISEEKFIKQLGVFDNLKMRLSYGQTGNQAIGDYSTLYILDVANYPVGGTENSGFASSKVVNKNLKWETTDQYNVGLDFGFLNNRLTFTAEYYYKKTKDLLQNVKIPTSTGYSGMMINRGFVTNEGLEFSASYNHNFTKDFSWRIDGNLSFNRNKIGGLESDQFAQRLWYQADNAFIQRNGLPIGAIYGYIEDGFYDNEAEVRLNPSYTHASDAVVKAMIGEVKYRRDPETNEPVKDIIGDTNPDYTFGITNTFNWKNWTLSFFIQGVQGNDIFNGNLMSVTNVGGTNIPEFAYNSRWTPETASSAKWPKATNQAQRTWLLSDRYVEDGSYIRLKNLNIGYTFRNPVKFVNSINVFASATNLFTISDYSWYDPDVNAFGGDASRRGIDIFSYPTSRTYSLGLKVEF